MIEVEYICEECKEFKITKKEKGDTIMSFDGSSHYTYYIGQKKEDLVCEKCGSYLVRGFLW